jgi:hypothetical protein
VTTGRVLWIIWCLAWAGFWIIAGWFLLGFNLVLAILSVVAIALPVGKPPTASLPPGYREEVDKTNRNTLS